MSPAELEQLVERHGCGWRLLAAQWSDDPDDCVQEALLRLVRQIPSPRHPAAWVFRVVRNLANSEHRRKETRQRHQDHLFVTQPMWAETDPTWSLQLSEIQRALEGLDDDRRTSVVSRIWGELTFAEIGCCLGCSTAKAHRLYDSAIEQLGRQLGAIDATSLGSNCRS